MQPSNMEFPYKNKKQKEEAEIRANLLIQQLQKAGYNPVIEVKEEKNGKRIIVRVNL